MTAMFQQNEMLARLGGDTELLEEIVALFRDECPGMVEAVREAVQADDAEQIYRSAHALKGALMNIAANPVAEKAAVIEAAGRNGALDSIDALFSDLEGAVDRLAVELAAVAQ